MLQIGGWTLRFFWTFTPGVYLKQLRFGWGKYLKLGGSEPPFAVPAQLAWKPPNTSDPLFDEC